MTEISGRDRLQAALAGNVVDLSSDERRLRLRLLEAILFAAPEPLDEAALTARLPGASDVPALLRELQAAYAPRGVNLVRLAGKWLFRTAEDLGPLLAREAVQLKKLGRAALETLAIIAYHQPVTRAEIEDIRGVGLSKGALDVLLEAGWVRMRGRRKTPGRPITYGTTDGFLVHFGLDSVGDLPGLDDFRAAGLLDGPARAGALPSAPRDLPDLRDDEEPLGPEPEDGAASSEAEAG